MAFTQLQRALSPFIFDDDGVRLIATYEGEQVIGKVSPHAMALASPVWKKLFYPPWGLPEAQSKQSEDVHVDKKIHQFKPCIAEVDFSEDSGPVLLILLRIAHLCFAKIPITLTFDELFNVAVLCNKYDCVHMLKPWLEQWLKFSEHGADRYNMLIFRAELSRSLFIAWVFGEEKLFRDIFRSKILSYKPTEELRDTPNSENQSMQQKLWFPSIEESCNSVRLQIIQQMINEVRVSLSRFSKKSSVICKYGKEECDASMYGSLLQGFEACGVYSSISERAAADLTALSIEKISIRLKKIKIYTMRDKNNFHLDCFPLDLRATFDVAQFKTPFDALDGHVRHIEIQRKKLYPEN